MMDEEGNYLNNVLQCFQWGCAKGSTRWQDGWNQAGQHRHLRQRERCLGSVQWKYNLWEMQADYSTLEPGLATLTDLISLNWWEWPKLVFLILLEILHLPSVIFFLTSCQCLHKPLSLSSVDWFWGKQGKSAMLTMLTVGFKSGLATPKIWRKKILLVLGRG